MKAYDSGLKGVTIYRDNCRTGVLVNTDSKKQDVFEQHDAPKRPEILPADIHTTTASGIKWNIVIGLFDSKPYEVFAIPYFTKEEHLEVKKLKGGRYDLLKNGETYSENITSEMNDEQEMITRLLSTSLRHGTNITFLVEQLSKTSGGITSFGKALTRTLKRYANTERLIAKQQCTECRSTNLIFEEGCLKCADCGNSKCG
jgi:ribonucleoside-diphosphate reductase alpha chain